MLVWCCVCGLVRCPVGSPGGILDTETGVTIGLFDRGVIMKTYLVIEKCSPYDHIFYSTTDADEARDAVKFFASLGKRVYVREETEEEANRAAWQFSSMQ